MGGRSITDLAQALLREPVEDSGSDTASRYNFQYQCIARHCFAMLNDSQLAGIICEWHVDYVLAYSNAAYELVSVKHREPSLGPWSFSDLWKRGGLATLYERWKSIPEAKCRLVTNGAYKSGQGETLPFPNALTKQTVGDYVEDVAKRLDCDIQQAKSFLMMLRIEHGIPDRVTLRSHEIVNTVGESLKQARVLDVDPTDAWDSVVNLVARKSRDLDNRDFSSVDLASPTALDAATLLSDKVTRRTISKVDVLEALSPTGISKSEKNATISNSWMREPTSNFVGRDDAFRSISEILESKSPIQSGLALVGMSGVGKSEILAQYAWQHESDYDFIWWVRSDSYSSMVADLASLCEKIGLAAPDTDEGMEKLKRYFRAHSGLVLLDGAPADPRVVSFIPRTSATRFIISSLDQGWSAHLPVVQVLPLAEDEAKLLLSAILTSASETELTMLTSALHGLPLALKQAAGYISTSGISIGMYCGMVNDRARELLHRAAPPEHVGLTAALSITIERLQNFHPTALGLLSVLSHLASSRFPTELFTLQISKREQSDEGALIREVAEIEELASVELSKISPDALKILAPLSDELYLFDSVADLQRFSLIDVHQGEVGCHALTQAVVRQSLSAPEQKASIEAGAVLLNKVATLSPYDSRYWPHYRHMMPHFETLIEHLKNQDHLISNTLMLHFAISISLGTQGSWEASLSYAEKAAAIAKEMDSLDQNVAALVQTVLIEALCGADRWNEALSLADEILDLDSSDQFDAVTIATVHTKKAAVLRLQGRLAEAMTEFDAAHTLIDSIDTNRTSSAMRSAIMANKATVQRENGDAAGAATEFERLISEYPETGIRNGLATLYSNLSLSRLETAQFAEALIAARRALEISSESVAGLHMDAARDWNNAGLALLELGRPNEAAEAFMASIRIHERLSSRKSSLHLIVRANLGRAQMAQGDFAAACRTLEETLKDQEAIVGPDHREVAATLANLAVAYTTRRNFGNAVAAAKRAIQIDVAVYGASHPELIADYHNMASALLLAESYRAALKWLVKAHKISSDTFGPDSLGVGTCLSKMAVCEYASGSFAEGFRLMHQAVDILEDKLASGHPEIASCRAILEQMRAGRYPLDLMSR
ncbi:dsDNA nuclease domain-containing protein [Streptomyces virginiae]|uniref:dsDNA nuclease domain-containing protein n=1 Tax=Streptomyces virginiae TaxID=1961 RepID=UPI0033AC8BA3